MKAILRKEKKGFGKSYVNNCCDFFGQKAVWCLYEDNEKMNLIIWSQKKNQAIQYAKENNIVITKNK